MATKKKMNTEEEGANAAGGEPKDFKHHLEEIAEILEWFDSQEELDVEQALEKVEKAAGLIKSSKKRLAEIENKFEEIKKEVEEEG